MEPEFTLFSIIMLLGAAHGLFLALALVNKNSGGGAGHSFLALLTLAFAIDLGHEFLYQSRYLLNVLMLVYIDPIINLFYGPSFYLYVRALTDGSAFKLRGKRWLHFLPIGISLGACLMLPELSIEQFTRLFYEDELAGVREERIVQSTISSIAMASVISIGAYLVLSISRLMRHARMIRQQFSSIERITLNWLRNLLIAILVLYLILMFDGFLSQIFGFDERVNNLLYLMVVAVIYTMGYLGLRQPAIFSNSATKNENAFAPVKQEQASKPKAKYESSALDAETGARLCDELLRHMEMEKPHLDNKLTLGQLAAELGVSSNYLSQVINEQLGKNFFDFINSHRVEEAKRLLVDPDQADTGILSIALEAGFNSKSVFYTAFKKHAGITPSQFRKSQRVCPKS